MEPKKRERRANHEGTPESKNGKHRYRGKVKGVLVSGLWMPTKTSAKQSFVEAKAAHARKLAEPEPTPVPTVADYAYATLKGTYAERVKNGTMAKSTWDLYEGFFANHLELSALGSMAIDKVIPADVERWIAGLMTTTQTTTNKKGETRIIRPSLPMHPNSKSRVVGFLSGIFTHARVSSKLIAENPVYDAEKPAFEETEFRVLTEEEIDRLIQQAKDWEAERIAKKEISEHVQGRALLIVLLGLHALGPAEMCGLKTDAFDGEGITIRLQSRRGKVTNRLKTTNRKGWVPVSEELKGNLLMAPPGWVLRTATGNPMQETALRRTFASIVKGTEFEGLRPYDLRHTFATRALIEGVDVRTVAEILRNTPEVVLRRYVKSEKYLKKRAISNVFKAKTPETTPEKAK
jgi:integrase